MQFSYKIKQNNMNLTFRRWIITGFYGNDFQIFYVEL